MNGIWAILWLFKPKHAAAEAVEIHGYSKMHSVPAATV